MVTKLSPLIRYGYIRASMMKNEVIKKLSNINGCFVGDARASKNNLSQLSHTCYHLWLLAEAQ